MGDDHRGTEFDRVAPARVYDDVLVSASKILNLSLSAFAEFLNARHVWRDPRLVPGTRPIARAALGVRVHKQDVVPCQYSQRGKIRSDRGFAGPTFLTSDQNNHQPTLNHMV